jgi:hypothetical protein
MILPYKSIIVLSTTPSGSIMECFYGLKLFGIPILELPPNLNIQSKEHCKLRQKWIEDQRTLEMKFLHDSLFLPKDIVVSPRLEDCLFGKGKPIMRHP